MKNLDGYILYTESGRDFFIKLFLMILPIMHCLCRIQALMSSIGYGIKGNLRSKVDLNHVYWSYRWKLKDNVQHRQVQEKLM